MLTWLKKEWIKTWYGRLVPWRVYFGYVLSTLWHTLFDSRYVALRRWHTFHVWFSWHPYIGGGLDFYIEFIPPFDVKEPDFEHHYGPEFKCGFTLLWIDVGLNIPNDDHPDNEVEMPKRYCQCGREASTGIKLACTGCQNVPDLCVCDLDGDDW